MSGSSPASGTVARSDLEVGAPIAEGGEGRVFALPDRPGVLYKEYRRPVDAASLGALVSWAEASTLPHPRLEVIRRCTAWPLAVVSVPRAAGLSVPRAAGLSMPKAAGLLMPRAPRRFSLRHRDGVARLATLSYLTADPVRRAGAYGLVLPPQGDPVRIGLVYALARLLEAMDSALESTGPAVGHGDLSAKNVLWSTQRGPEVFLLDCDNGELFDVDGAPIGPSGRRRAMTPNWDDPAVPAGDNPGLAADRYSLALIFLRVVGAAHFPVQKRQKSGEAVEVDLDLPPTVLRAATMAPDAPLWALVSRGLSASAPADRPPASTWAAALHDVLVDLHAGAIIEGVHVAQGSSTPSIPARPIAGPPAPDVSVRPRGARPRGQVPIPLRRPSGAGGGRPRPLSSAGSFGSGAAPAGWAAMTRPTAAPAPLLSRGPTTPAPMSAQARAGLTLALSAWTRLHRRAARSLASRGRRAQGIRRLAVCVLVDFAVASVGLLLVAMAVSPFLGL